MDDQDWTVVTIRSKHKKQPMSSISKPDRISSNAHELRKVEQMEMGVPKILTAKSRSDMAVARVAKKLTQKQLDIMGSFPSNSCNAWEAGRICPTSNQIQSLHRILSIKLVRE